MRESCRDGLASSPLLAAGGRGAPCGPAPSSWGCWRLVRRVECCRRCHLLRTASCERPGREAAILRHLKPSFATPSAMMASSDRVHRFFSAWAGRASRKAPKGYAPCASAWGAGDAKDAAASDGCPWGRFTLDRGSVPPARTRARVSGSRLAPSAVSSMPSSMVPRGRPPTFIHEPNADDAVASRLARPSWPTSPPPVSPAGKAALTKAPPSSSAGSVKRPA
mmetsp:Transcript_23541/g.63797  ORF Transcript_23541/g.63797 Transcript_23541/m.63797 type:complete len:222 (-) Transcript_23541:1003-1668(-)